VNDLKVVLSMFVPKGEKSQWCVSWMVLLKPNMKGCQFHQCVS